MSDLIERQAVLDALSEWGDAAINNRINNLPSADPNRYKMKPVEDCISRQAAIEHYRVTDPAGTFAYCNSIIEFLESLPSAQPRMKGKWIRYGEDGNPNEEDTVFWQCDQCLETYTGRTTRIPNYCPNCGAEMRGGGEDERTFSH